MTSDENKRLEGVLLDRNVTFTVTEFSHVCGVDTELVREMVIEGVIEPEEAEVDNWRFSGEALVRAQCALRLVRDLHVNWPGAALALDLLEELDEYARRLTESR